MSTDRRPLEECEILYIFEHYLRNWCDDHEGENTVVITNSNGKKIFEGDIVEFRTSLKKYYAKVYYKRGMYSLYIKGFNDRYALNIAVENDYSVKVIGNIHDNPELLEGKNEAG